MSLLWVCFSRLGKPRKKQPPPNRSCTHSRARTKKPFSKEEGTESGCRCSQSITMSSNSSSHNPMSFFFYSSFRPSRQTWQQQSANNMTRPLLLSCTFVYILRSFPSCSTSFLHTPRNRLSAQPSLLLKNGGIYHT